MGKHDLVRQQSLKPVAKVVAALVAWLGTTAGLAVVAQVSDSIDQKTVLGGLAVGALTTLAGYLKRSHAGE
jgi:hypothetical protein